MKTLTRFPKFASAVILLGAMLNAYSATTQIATEPLITSTTVSVLPNVFLMMDDSGSMGWDYMPDNAKDFGAGTYGAASYQCNGVSYDPFITYTAPVNYDGTSFSNATFTGAWNDGYNTGGSSTDLSASFVDAGGDTAQPAFYYIYSGAQTTEKLKDYYNTNSTFYKECNSAVTTATIAVSGSNSTTVTSVTVNGTTITLPTSSNNSNSSSTLASYITSAINASGTGYSAKRSSSTVTITGIKPSDVGTTPTVSVSSGTMSFSYTNFTNTTGASKFTKVLVSSTSGPGATDERTNFANWWSYYHTRILMMKTATGLAFKTICPTTPATTCNFRVGFATINNNTGSDLLSLNTFDATQKSNWYTKLYATQANNSTPLREALADVGRMYAHKLPSSNSNNALNSGSVPDPIQYACQQNFTILTTDGFWNGATTYNLNGSTVGNQDYFEPRPMYDGSNYSQTTTTPYTTVQTRQTVTSGADTTVTWLSTRTTIGAACSVAAVVPSGTTTAPMTDNNRNIALGLSATNPDSGYCHNLAANAWICRSHTSSGSPAVSAATVTDSNGTPWYLMASSSTLGSGCVNDEVAFNDTNYSKRRGACPGTLAVTGSYVTKTPVTQTETISGAVTTAINEYTAYQQTTQTTINGVAGPVSALTPSTLTYTFTNNVSTVTTGGKTPPYTWSPSTATATDVYGPWTDGTPTTTCVATASVPAPSWLWDPAPSYTASSLAGTSNTTVLSTVGPTAGTPSTTSSSSAGTSNTLADVAEYYYITDLRTSALGNNLSAAPGGSWTGTDISNNVVPSSGLDTASHQHMTTFTLGLGARGRMVFDPAYASETAASIAAGGPRDFYDVLKGSTASASVCSWQSSGNCNWPTPGSDKIENIDDLWHAAVNGRGSYFSAANPTGLATALSSALAGVSARTGSASAATTSNAFVTQGDNFLFRSTYLTQAWSGELLRQQLDVTTGAVLTTIDWSAQAKLDANASRNIYFFNSSSANNLASFTLPNLTSAGLDSNFNQAHIAPLSQLVCNFPGNCLASWAANTSYTAGNEYMNGTTWYHVNTTYTSGATFGATDTTNSSVVTGIAGLNLVNFIRGDRTYEGAETDNINGKYYRQRSHVLGDIVNSESHYVKGAMSPFYADPGYSTFASSVSNRQAMVYVGANDGMLHAFYAADGMMDSATGQVVSTGGVSVTGGNEAWAFIPTAVMPNLYKLADKEYNKSNFHQYFVDGSPEIGDICVSNCTNTTSPLPVWKTILVGGLNDGGTSYYALDVTNPAHPIALWEFTTSNMGFTYGNPKIVKLGTGQWVVLFTSGYNNTAGDGLGHLYVVDAYTGTLVRDISTSAGSPTTPSNLGRLDAWLTTPGVNATAEAVYAGDMLGNLWRFDINNTIGAAGYDAQLLVTLTGPSGNVQPITTKPLLTLNGTAHMIDIGTGRYLGANDQSDTSQQSFYAIADNYPTGTTPSVAVYGIPRSGGFVQQTQTSTTCPVGTSASICTSGQTVVISSNSAVTLSSTVHGWFFDFPVSSSGAQTGERVNTDPAIRNGAVIINTNVPNSSSCSVGGDSFQYQLDYRTGGALSTSTTGVIATKLGNELSSRPVVVTLPDGTTKIYTQGSGGGTPTSTTGWGGGGGGNSTVSGVPSRKSWRELIQQ